jgi:hypothetical protein
MNDNDRNGEETFSFLFSLDAGETGKCVGWSAGMYWLLAIEISTCVVRGNKTFSLEENLGIRTSSTACPNPMEGTLRTVKNDTCTSSADRCLKEHTTEYAMHIMIRY